jgi:hypothetical protein
MKLKYLIFAFIFSLLFIQNSEAQINISGKILDSASRTALPYANLYLVNKMYGAASNAEGKFFLQLSSPDTLIVSMVGYHPTKIACTSSKSDIEIVLSRKPQVTAAVKIVAKKAKRKKNDPAEAIMKKVIEHKDENNYKKLKAYECTNYTKIQFNLNNADTNLANVALLKPIGFMFRNIDSTTFKKPSIPIMISESSTKYFYKTSPNLENEVVEASKVSGIDHNTVAEFTSNFYMEYNIYDDYIFNFNRNFVGPLATLGTLSYDYILVDTIRTDTNSMYHLFYVPLRKQELTFRGHLYIDSATYAVCKANLEMSKDANINFVKSMEMDKFFQRVDGHWVPAKETIFLDVNLADKQYGMYGLKQTFSSKYTINQPKDNSFFNQTTKVVVKDTLKENTSDYWQTQRPQPLNDNELAAYAKIDSALHSRYFVMMKRLSMMFASGYYPLGKWEYGPYFTTYSFNNIEGNRFKFTGRTTAKFSKKWRFLGHVAYGTTDKRVKYKFTPQYYFKMSPRSYMGFDLSSDLEVMNASPDAFQNDNIMASLSRKDSVKFLFIEKYTGYYEREWAKGNHNRITFGFQNIKPVAPLFFEQPNGNHLNSIKIASVMLSGRIAYKEKILEDDYRRVSLKTKYPIFTYSYEFAAKGILGSQYAFHRAKIKMVDKWYIGNAGHIQVVAEAGKIWGTVPYPLLTTHVGNNSYYFDAEAFNLMKIFEFVSDEYVQMMATYHLEGFIFNKLPLFRKLQWRELAFARGLMGRLSNTHAQEVKLPTGMSALNEPYLEAGVGIENIFKVLRVDALWRFTNLNGKTTPTFGITAVFKVYF